MSRTPERAAFALLVGAAAVFAAALAPAGLRGGDIPVSSWVLWALLLLLALLVFARSGVRPVPALARIAWLLPFVTLLALPAAWFAPRDRAGMLLAALVARALAATAVAAATAEWLGARGLLAAMARLGVPARFRDVSASALASLDHVARQVRAMLRARAARRAGGGAWAPLVRAPRETVRGYGRLVAALLLRSLERAESLDRARRARGIDA